MLVPAWGRRRSGQRGDGNHARGCPRAHARVSRGSPDAPRGPRQPARGRTRGNRRVFWLPNLGRARCVSRRAARPGAAADVCAGGGAADSRALLSPGCCCVARVYCRRSRLSSNGASSSSPSNSSQVYVSRFRRACLADRAPNIFFGRAKFKLVLLNASSASRAASAHLRSRRAVHLSESRAGCVPSFAALTAALGHFTA